MPRAHPLAWACALALGMALGVTPHTAAAQTVGGQGGQGLTPGGNSGNGGDAVPIDTNILVVGSDSSAGNGGDGASGNLAGGAGGSVGTTIASATTVTTTTAGGNASAGSSDGTSRPGGGGGGGAGVYVSATSGISFTNQSAIQGGNGGAGGNVDNSVAGGGGGGGSGVIGQNFTLTNTGSITGGVGGAGGGGTYSSAGGGGGGGNGLAGAGLTIINSGTISGGAGGAGGIDSGNSGGNGGAGSAGDAILFTGGTNSLTLNAGSVLNGAVEVTGSGTALIDVDTSGLNLSGGSLGNTALIVNAPTTLSLNNGAFTVSGNISGNSTLGIEGSDMLTLGTVNLRSLVDGTPTTLTGNVTTNGGEQLYAGALTLGADLTMADTGGGEISLYSTVDGAHDLSVSTTGKITFLTSVGLSTPLTSLTTNSGTFMASGLLTIGGNLSITTSGGGISQVGPWTVYGSSNFSAGNNAITLTNADDFFLNEVNLSNRGANDVALANIGPLLLGNVSVGSGSLTLAGNGIFQFGTSITQAAGAGAVTLNAGNGPISLGSPGDGLTGTVNLSNSGANNVSLYNLGPLTLGDVTVGSGTLSLSGAGITQATGTSINQAANAGAATFKAGSGAITLTNAGNAFTGVVNLSGSDVAITTAGALTLNDVAASGQLAVNSGGALNIIGNVSAASTNLSASGNTVLSGSLATTGGATISGDFTAAQGSVLNYTLGAPGANFQTPSTADSVSVSGNLVLDGATLNVANAGGMGPGLYNVFSYGGTLTESNGGLLLGTTPAGQTLFLQNLTGQQQINLIDSTGYTLDVWNANGQASSTRMGGGSGTWSATSPMWTDATGSVPNGSMPLQPGFAVFGGTPGTVTVDDSAGAISATGMQFAVNGDTLTGDTLTLVAGSNGAAPIIRVGDGASTGAAMTATIGNVIAGSAGLDKTDLGTLVLTGSNTYTGGTTISGGTLQLGNGGTAGSITGDVIDNGTLAFDHGSAVGFAGLVTGTGSLAQRGTGVLTLTGANSYSGGTTISSGTLALSGSGSIADSSVADNATLDISATQAGAAILSLSGNGAVTLGSQTLSLSKANDTFGGVIAGTGGLTLLAGTETLTGANMYSGGTTISGGTLQGNSSSLQGAITNNAALVFNQVSDGTFAGAISGSGTLTKAGSGLLILDGNSPFTGNTTVSDGTLEVGDANTSSAFLGGNVQVAAGGTLRGHGTIGGDVVNSGTIYPGGSVGVLTINGNYTQNSDGSLQIDVTPTQASELLVHGNASLAGNLNLIYAPGTYTATTYTLVQATAITGNFATTNSGGAVPTALNPTVTYTGTQVELALSTPAPAPPVVRFAPLDGTLYANLMRAVNLGQQQTLSTVLDAALLPNDCGNSMAPSSPNGPTAQNVTTCKPGLWLQATGDSLQLDGTPGLRSTAFGLLGGFDGALTDALHVGVEAGLGRLNGNDALGGNGSIDSAHAGIYSFADVGPLVLSGTIDGAHDSYRVNRETGIGPSATQPNGDTLSAGVQVAWPLQAQDWKIVPRVGALYQHQALDGFNETLASSNPLASAYAISGSRSTYTTLQPYAGVSFTRSFQSAGVTYVPQLDLGYRYDTRGEVPTVVSTAQDGTVFALPANTMGRSQATLGARITAQAGATWNLYLDYQGAFGSQLHDNALTLGFTKHF
jgi:autotransporter-associated beta strand protein